MTELLSLGSLYVSDFLAPDEQPRAAPADLTLVMDDDGLVHLASQPPAELMWGRYWYRSGTNATMRAELFDIVQQVRGVVSLEPGDLWVDIASNDGTLLSFVDEDVWRYGVDPVKGEIYDEACRYADRIVQQPFSLDMAHFVAADAQRQAKVITCIAMFYDLMDPTDFLAGVYELLDRDGVFVLQMSYTPLMLEQLAFDNICHEHARYYTLTTLAAVLHKAGFQVMDCELNATNGGSFRVYAMRADADVTQFATQPYRDVAAFRVASLLARERLDHFNQPGPWDRFRRRVEQLRYDIRSFVYQAWADGRSIYAYGASTKGNTLLQFCGLDHTRILRIAERQEAKVGLRTVGTDIPIIGEHEWRMSRADYTLILPWQFRAEFCEREADYLARGGQFVVPCPKFEIIGDGPAMAIGDGRKPA